MMGWLVDGSGRQHALRPEGPTTIGRAPSNDIALADSTVSQSHAVIFFDAAGALLRDLGSSNGTFVEATRVNECRLADRARIRLGGVELTFRTDAQPPALSNAGTHRSKTSSGSTDSAEKLLLFGAQKKSGWLAAFINLVFPGAGYAYCDRWGLGVFVFVLYMAIIVVGSKGLGLGLITPVGLMPITFLDGFLVAAQYNKTLMDNIIAGGQP